MKRRVADRGQSTVEFAVLLPVLLVLMLAVVHVAVVVMTKFAVTHTAREVARVLAIDPSADAELIAARARPFGQGEIEVAVTRHQVGDRWFVEVRVIDQVDGLLPSWLADPEVATTVAMVGE